MRVSANIDVLRTRIAAFSPVEHQPTRTLCFYSAAIASADNTCMDASIDLAVKHGLGRPALYEIVLQSYLFLGFPRMLIAAEQLDQRMPSGSGDAVTRPISPEESQRWFDDGVRLCRRVYGGNYEALKGKVEAIAPEIFRWMIVEGYGKVLSRPGLDSMDRELSIASFLMMEDREQQLYSHMKGALNVGAPGDLLTLVVNDIGEAAGAGYDTALGILDKLGVK